MADPQTTPSLAPLDALETTPPPITAGYGNPLAGIAAEFFKLHSADNRRQANRELDRREELAQRFDQFSNDPRYANHPDLQREAHMHAAQIRQIPYNKNLPSQYKPNPDGLIPAYGALFHRAAQAEIRKNGEPAKPAEPAQPAAPANPFATAPPAPSAGPFGPTDLATGVSAGPPLGSRGPVGAVPLGGVHTAPGRISPSPAIGTAPPAPNAMGGDGGTPAEEIYPMTPPEMTAFNNSIPVHGALAEALGVPDGSTIDMRELQRGSSLVKGSADRKAKLLLKGLSEDGDPLPLEQLPPELQMKRQHLDAQERLMDASIELKKATASAIPERIKIARDNLSIAKQRAAAYSRYVDNPNRAIGGAASGLGYGGGAPAATPTPSSGNGPASYSAPADPSASPFRYIAGVPPNYPQPPAGALEGVPEHIPSRELPPVELHPEVLAGVDPNTATTIRSIAEYRSSPNVISVRSNRRELVLGLVNRYKPSYDSTQFDSIRKLRTDFNSGKAAANARSINTAIAHLDTLSRAASQLDNAPVTLWNKIANAGLQAAGDPRVDKFNTAANAVRNELAAVFKGTGATDQEIAAWRESINSSQSPEQLHGSIQTAIELMAGRVSALDAQWTQGTGEPRDFTLLNPQSRAILRRIDSALDPDAMDGAQMGKRKLRGAISVDRLPPPPKPSDMLQTIPAAAYDAAVAKFGKAKVDAKYSRGN